MTDMTNAAARLDLYARIYATDAPIHPKKGKLAPYGAQTDRDAPFVEYMERTLPTVHGVESPRVLDASCGRGHLSEALTKRGYRVHATEVAPGLVQDLRERAIAETIWVLTYGELGHFADRSYDAVISNDVLEHLPEEEAIAALRDLSRITRRHLLVSVGLGHGAVKYPEALGLGRVDLHLFCPGAARWEKEFQRVGRIVEIQRTPKTLWAFMEVGP